MYINNVKLYSCVYITIGRRTCIGFINVMRLLLLILLLLFFVKANGYDSLFILCTIYICYNFLFFFFVFFAVL